jgi:AMP deaminase
MIIVLAYPACILLIYHTMQDMIDRVFAPLFEVSVTPGANLPLHAFLKTIVGFDSVDDESKAEQIQVRIPV